MRKLWVENIENPSVLYQESQPEGDWLDKDNDAIEWYKHGLNVLDFIFVREKVNTILFPICNPNYPTIDFSGWGALTAEQKSIMTKFILAPYALRMTVLSDEEDKANWNHLIQITQGIENPKENFTGRALIIERMRWEVANLVRKEELSMVDSQQFFKDVYQFVDWYIRAAIPDFKLWINNEGEYTNDGFAQKSYYTQGLKDSLMLIYEGL